MRHDGRQYNDLRPIRVEKNFLDNGVSSALVSVGKTRVLCTGTIEEATPRFLKDTGKGWLTAEYAMLPGSSAERIRRDVSRGYPSGRTMEIQRLIGRSLRAAVDMAALGERSIIIDCDVIQADGGTRTTAITGGMIVLQDLVERLLREGQIATNPIQHYVAAVSLGIVHGDVVLDLDYVEDSQADVDMNLVMTDAGHFIEVQATSEHQLMTQAQLTQCLALGQQGIQSIIQQTRSVASAM
jgi:ribonuclease PH